MIPQIAKNEVRQRVHQRIRRKLNGTPERPRLSVYRSLNHIYAQLIDDMAGQTVAAANSREGAGKVAAGAKKKTGCNVAVAKEVGKLLAERAKAKGVGKVVFDRGGYLYHGRVKALADAARAAGLQF